MSENDTVEIHQEYTEDVEDPDFDICNNQNLLDLLDLIESRTYAILINAGHSPAPLLRDLLQQIQVVQDIIHFSRLHQRVQRDVDQGNS